VVGAGDGDWVGLRDYHLPPGPNYSIPRQNPSPEYTPPAIRADLTISQLHGPLYYISAVLSSSSGGIFLLAEPLVATHPVEECARSRGYLAREKKQSKYDQRPFHRPYPFPDGAALPPVLSPYIWALPSISSCFHPWEQSVAHRLSDSPVPAQMQYLTSLFRYSWPPPAQTRPLRPYPDKKKRRAEGCIADYRVASRGVAGLGKTVKSALRRPVSTLSAQPLFAIPGCPAGAVTSQIKTLHLRVRSAGRGHADRPQRLRRFHDLPVRFGALQDRRKRGW